MRDELLFYFFIQNLNAGPTATDCIPLTHLYTNYIYFIINAIFVIIPLLILSLISAFTLLFC